MNSARNTVVVVATRERLIWDSSKGTYNVGTNAAKRLLGKGRQRVKRRKALQRARRAARAGGAREARPHRSGGGK